LVRFLLFFSINVNLELITFMPHKRIFIKVHGSVIGVNFRYYTNKLAKELGIYGYVKNCPDHTVEIQAEGAQHKLQKLLSWANAGPKDGRVDKADHQWQETKNEFDDFNVLY